MAEAYDLVVIGAGPAGEVAASFGRRALVVERNKPGGVVTTTGRRTHEGAARSRGLPDRLPPGGGLRVRSAVPLDEVLPIFRARVERVCDVLQGAVEQRLAARGIGYLQGTARLCGAPSASPRRTERSTR
jgi:pyruvate/2-oxoglutarate dehydrogenase complex dihydrolipoamide dehydrogenase (E3) component